MKKGKLIIIDGSDGSGKTTQINLLVKKLKTLKYQLQVIDFPQYNTKSAGLVEEYLSGKYGSAEQVGPYRASIFYAADRYDASFKIKRWLEQGKVVIANRYVTSNMAHQGLKISNPLLRKKFFQWLYNLEYKIFEIPKPDLTIILSIDAKIAQQLIKGRNRQDWLNKIHDIHEEDLSHLKSAEKIYLEIAKNMPKTKLIKCVRQDKLLGREEIHEKILKVIKISNSNSGH